MIATLILGALAFLLVFWALNVIAKFDSLLSVRLSKAVGGLLALGFGVFLGLRGQIGLAVPLGIFGLGLLGWLPYNRASSFLAGRISRVYSAYLEIELDRNSGVMRGRFITGPHRGTELDRLPISTLIAMLPQIDEESRALLMAYLDRREARWREHAQGDTAAGGWMAMRGKMTDQEAYQILGLETGAGAEAIRRAHRALIKKIHPDHGGSAHLAARVNEAKEVLLRRHR